MKKLIILGSILFGSVTCFAAGPSASITIANDYNWRGLTFTNSGPAVQGSIGYATDFGLGGGLWASNHVAGYQGTPYLYYWHAFGDVTVNVQVLWYTFTGASQMDSLAPGVSASFMHAKVGVDFMGDYFGTKTANTYFYGQYTLAIDDKLSFVPSVGMSSFADAKKTSIFGAGSSNSHMNYKLAFDYKKDDVTVELAFTATDRKLIDATGTTTKLTATSADNKYLISMTKSF
jgi:uncharacterized protein (TIGR02001 family)